MTDEILNILIDNIDDIDLIKKISEQDDYVITNIIDIFNNNYKIVFEQNNISNEKRNIILSKMLDSKDSDKISNLSFILFNINLFKYRTFDEICSMIDAINTSKSNGLSDRRYVFVSKIAIEKLKFEDQLKLFYDELPNINVKTRLLSLIYHCYDYDNEKDISEITNLILNSNDIERLNSILDYIYNINRNKFSLDNFKNILINYCKDKKIKKVKDNYIDPDSLYSKLTMDKIKHYKFGIVQSFKNNNNYDLLTIKHVEDMVNNINNPDLLEGIYDVVSCNSVKLKITESERLDIISYMKNNNEKNAKFISSVFTNEEVLDNRTYSDIKRIIDCILSNKYNDFNSLLVLLNNNILKYRSTNESFYLLDKLVECKDKEVIPIILNIMTLTYSMENVSFEEQKKEIDLLNEINNFEIKKMVATFFENSKINVNRNFDERLQIAKMVTKKEDSMKSQALISFLYDSCFLNILTYEDEMAIADLIDRRTSSKEALYVSMILTNLLNILPVDKDGIIKLFNKESVGIDKIDDIKGKLKLTELVNSSNSVNELKSKLANINKVMVKK